MFCINLGSFSADQPLSLEFTQNLAGSDDLQPCIEDIRLEIDRLRREEQLLREKYVSSSSHILRKNLRLSFPLQMPKERLKKPLSMFLT